MELDPKGFRSGALNDVLNLSGKSWISVSGMLTAVIAAASAVTAKPGRNVGVARKRVEAAMNANISDRTVSPRRASSCTSAEFRPFGTGQF